MSPWDGWRDYPPAPKRPPPEHGVRLKKAGTTWWGQRWLEALQHVLRGDAGRLSRGRTYARAGRTHDFIVEGGKVTAKVTGSRPEPYAVHIELTQIAARDWQKAIAALAEKAQFAAELLAGQMPQEIDAVFRAAGTRLFPAQRTELRTSCSCPDWGDPCKHVAAAHYVLGEALDRDPFLLFELRGRSRDQVLAALRAARGGAESGAPATASEATSGDAPETATISLDALTPGAYDRAREPLPTLHFSFDPPVTHGAVLRQLGNPAAWTGPRAPAELLEPLVRAAAETARRIALTDADAREEGDVKESALSDAAPKGTPRASRKQAARTRPRPRRTPK